MSDTLLSRLEKVKDCGNGRYMAACPSHQDSDPSLSIAVLQDGRILMKCFAGCATSDVMAAIGLSLGDLFPDGAVVDRIRGWHHSNREYEEKFRDKVVLALAEEDRKRGVKLSKADLERERLAYRRLNGAM